VPPLRKGRGGDDDDLDVSCFDEYDLNCEHPGAAYEHSKAATRKGRFGKEDVFAGF
jgi:hypothetical protein